MLLIVTILAILCTFSLTTLSQTVFTPTPTTTPTLTCSNIAREGCIQLYYENVSFYSESNFSQVYLQICEISQPVSPLLCAYTSFLVTCIRDEVSSRIMSGTNSRNLDAEARNILQDCSANTTSIPNDRLILSNFAETVNSIGFYGYYINQGLFSNLQILVNLSTLVLREINSLCVSYSANSLITNASSLTTYINELNIANLTQINCTKFCPECPTRYISTRSDPINSKQFLCQTISSTNLVMNCLCENSMGDIGEACDDGNRDDSDGCSSLCLIEDGWSCNEVFPSMCSMCGNDILEYNEQCNRSMIFCDNTCMVRELYNCIQYDTGIGYNNCTSVNLDTNTSDPGTVNSVYSASGNIFQLTIDLIKVSNFTLTESINYTLVFSKVDNEGIDPASNPLSINLNRLTENLNLTSLTFTPTIMITQGDEFITTYIIDSVFRSMKQGASYSDCLLALINVTEISLDNRPAGKLFVRK